MREFYLPSTGGGTLRCGIWEPREAPRAVVQLVHGIAEHIERYEEAVLSAAHALVNQYDTKLAAAAPAARAALREEANLALAAMIQEKASDTLDKVLFELSNQMKNAYSRSDA